MFHKNRLLSYTGDTLIRNYAQRTNSIQINEFANFSFKIKKTIISHK